MSRKKNLITVILALVTQKSVWNKRLGSKPLFQTTVNATAIVAEPVDSCALEAGKPVESVTV